MIISSLTYEPHHGVTNVLHICEDKDADQPRLCFRYIASTIPLLPKSKISSLLPYSLAVQWDLCLT